MKKEFLTESWLQVVLSNLSTAVATRVLDEATFDPWCILTPWNSDGLQDHHLFLRFLEGREPTSKKIPWSKDSRKLHSAGPVKNHETHEFCWGQSLDVEKTVWIHVNMWTFARGFLIMSLQLGGQKKHGHAVNTQGVRSQKCCGESPRALGQRVPLGDQKAETLEQTAMLHAELWFWAFGPLQQHSYAVSICKNANRTGLTLFMLSFCSSAARGFSCGILLSSAMLTLFWWKWTFECRWICWISNDTMKHMILLRAVACWIFEFMSTCGHLQEDFWS